MFKNFTTCILAFIVSLSSVQAMSKTVATTGAISGEILFRTNNSDISFYNVQITLGTYQEKVLNRNSPLFYFGEVPSGKNKLILRVHDPIYGNFEKTISDLVVPEYNVLKLGQIYLSNIDRVKSFPLRSKTAPNKKITIAEFPFEGASLGDAKKEGRALFQKQNWQEILLVFGDTVFEEYKKYSGNLIVIKGFSSPSEFVNAPDKRKQLAVDRAEFIYNFLLSNFLISGESFVITVGDEKDLVSKKNLFDPKNLRVEIDFYSENYY